MTIESNVNFSQLYEHLYSNSTSSTNASTVTTIDPTCDISDKTKNNKLTKNFIMDDKNAIYTKNTSTPVLSNLTVGATVKPAQEKSMNIQTSSEGEKNSDQISSSPEIDSVFDKTLPFLDCSSETEVDDDYEQNNPTLNGKSKTKNGNLQKTFYNKDNSASSTYPFRKLSGVGINNDKIISPDTKKVRKPILRISKSNQLNYIVFSSTDSIQDATIFGTQINIHRFLSPEPSSADIPLPSNEFESVSIRINRDVKESFKRRKRIEDKGGYYELAPTSPLTKSNYSNEDCQNEACNIPITNDGCNNTTNGDMDEFAIIRAYGFEFPCISTKSKTRHIRWNF
ncbi:Sfg1p SCDLUD_000786 [Saccharomycodes ludwigii]|uniref:Sfg1p n=1 Tax=Saccharomycodes ludwigii TaxID=36035 RepID=UPI001E8A9901|nr:hypothetical protein SCDLUD_000786 [Saccharomycodes ludwigii]KAH3903172.1 hypothetical protein SCDLUD_000786 [Saccharomycodes ludwigii]